MGTFGLSGMEAEKDHSATAISVFSFCGKVHKLKYLEHYRRRGRDPAYQCLFVPT